MAENLSEEQIADLKEAFIHFDKDGDGCITMEELEEMLVSFGQDITHTDDELEAMIIEVDVDENGLINFPDFLDFMAENMQDLIGTIKRQLQSLKLSEYYKAKVDSNRAMLAWFDEELAKVKQEHDKCIQQIKENDAKLQKLQQDHGLDLSQYLQISSDEMDRAAALQEYESITSDEDESGSESESESESG